MKRYLQKDNSSSLFAGPTFGPTFGAGHDLVIHWDGKN